MMQPLFCSSIWGTTHYQGVNPSIRGQAGFRQAPGSVILPDISRHILAARPHAPDLFLQRFQGRLVCPVDHQIRPMLRKGQGNCFSDSPGGAGDNGRISF